MSKSQHIGEIQPNVRDSGDRGTEIQTIEQIATNHQDQWVVIVDYVTDDALEVRSGRVVAHGFERDQVLQQLPQIRPVDFAIYYFGSPPADLGFLL